MDETIHHITLEREFRLCPECGYKDGFHTILRKEDGKVRSLYICPACHALFDVALNE